MVSCDQYTDRICTVIYTFSATSTFLSYKNKATTATVTSRGNLATNDGEIAVNWALDGHGILMRAEWDIDRYLKNGRLVQVLPQYFTPDADIHAVYPQRHQLAARVRSFVDFVALSFNQQAAASK